MCSLTELLQRSCVAGPFVRLAQLPSDQVRQWLDQSRLLKIAGLVLSPLLIVGDTIRSRWSMLVDVMPIVLLLSAMGLIVALGSLSTGQIGILTWAVLGLSLAWLALAKNRLPFSLSIVDLLVLAFVASALISAGFSSYLKYSAVGFAKMLTFLAGYFAFRVLSMTYHQNLQKRSLFFWLAALLALIGLFQSVVGFYQFSHHVEARATWVDPTINPELNMTRIFGTLQPANPNLLAGFLIPCLTAALGLTVWSVGRWIGDLANQASRLVFLQHLAAVMLTVGSSGAILAALVLTGSRGGFLAIAGIVLGFFAMLGHLLWNPGSGEQNSNPWISRKALKMLWVLILVGSIASAGLLISRSPQLQHRVASIFAMRKDSSISYRLNVYDSVTRMVKDNPIVGVGPGNDTFKRVYGYYMVPGFNALGAYSVPLEIAAEQGLLGLSIFMLLLLCLAIRTLYFLETDRPLFEKMAVIVLFCGILGSLAYGAFDTIWYRPSVNLLFWLYVALLVQLTRPLEQRA